MLQWTAVAEDLTRIKFHQGDVLQKLMKVKGMKQKDLSRATGHQPATLKRLLDGVGTTEPHIVADILRALEIESIQVEALVSRMNGGVPDALPIVRPLRQHNERAEDRDPDRHEAMMYVHKILSFSAVTRMVVYNMIQGIETILRAPKHPPPP
jgi:lambda repressor-like predicted transcriptional regulator